MARGTARFSPSALQAQRLNTDGRPDRTSLTAEELARRVGAAKSHILAYENGHRVPDPPRISALAHALKVQPRQLMDLTDGRAWTLADWRRAQGLRAQDVVEILGISVKNYRRFETEGIVPSRRPQFVDEVARALAMRRPAVEAAMDRTPAVRRRQARAYELVVALAELYVPRRGPWRGPAPDDPHLTELAAAYGRPVQRLQRVLTHELGELRQSQVRALRERVIADYDPDRDRQANAQYAVDRWSEVYERDLGLIPQRLERFHRTAQPSDLWQILADLYTVDATVRADAGTWVPTALLGRPADVLPPHFVEHCDVGDVPVCRLTAQGANHVVSFHGLYAALYPTTRRPLRPAAVAARGSGKARAATAEAFTLPGHAQRLVVPHPVLESVRLALTGPRTSFHLALSPTVGLMVALNTLSASPADQSPPEPAPATPE
ncbi:helix-turn-helix domain-containing protein [Streptomyces sp. NPDC086091]|uniref:helix-turn-helix domain-containing protein n=1 Tax=Streptomyces sp. NPDC086091 TaxID=3365751 RepID=UPI0037F32E28